MGTFAALLLVLLAQAPTAGEGPLEPHAIDPDWCMRDFDCQEARSWFAPSLTMLGGVAIDPRSPRMVAPALELRSGPRWRPAGRPLTLGPQLGASAALGGPRTRLHGVAQINLLVEALVFVVDFGLGVRFTGPWEPVGERVAARAAVGLGMAELFLPGLRLGAQFHVSARGPDDLRVLISFDPFQLVYQLGI